MDFYNKMIETLYEEIKDQVTSEYKDKLYELAQIADDLSFDNVNLKMKL